MACTLKRIVALCLLCLMLAAPVQAADGSKGLDSIFWKKLRIRLQLVVPERSSAFAPVDESALAPDATDTLYWKGREPLTVVPEAELAAFNRALQHALDGAREQAVQGFRDFLARYAGSRLAGEAQAALAELEGGASQ